MGLIFLVSYLLGSIPFGLLLTRVFGLEDLRKIGSGNIGATNVLRTGKKSLAALTLFLDSFKGAFLILFFGMNEEPWIKLLIGLCAILGHCFPVWLKFKGGKGVATALGVLLAATPLAGFIACLAWIISFFIARISSVAALSALLFAPVVILLFYGVNSALVSGAISLLVFIRHKDNIQRLMKGEEPHVKKKGS